jgi:hypothetical protein
VTLVVGKPRRILRTSEQTERPCRECSEIFTPKRNTQGIFCSKPCKYRYGRRTYKGIGPDGYVWIYPDVDLYSDAKNYNGATVDGRIREHRYVMQEHIGRALTEQETVHHINGDKMDNRIENLELWGSRHPKGVLTTINCPHCGQGITV